MVHEPQAGHLVVCALNQQGNNVNTLEWFLDSPARGRSYPESLIKKNKRGPGNHRPDLVCFL